MVKRQKAKRPEFDTLLLVGEGDSEVAFLKHAKALYVQRGCGLQVTIKCAHGKAAAHVIDVAIREKRANSAFNQIAVLLDTDIGWTDAVAKRAREHGILVMCSVPMFEAMMLRIHGKRASGSADELKKRFTNFIKNSGYLAEHYQTHYNQEVLQHAASSEEAIQQLLQLLRAGS